MLHAIIYIQMICSSTLALTESSPMAIQFLFKFFANHLARISIWTLNKKRAKPKTKEKTL